MEIKDNFDGNWYLDPEIQNYIRVLAEKEAKQMIDDGIGGYFGADDLAQQVNLDVELQKDRFQPDMADTKTYVHKIACGTFMRAERFLKQQKRDVRLTFSLFERCPGNDADDDAPISDYIDFGDHPDVDLFVSHLPGTDDFEFLNWLDHITTIELKPELCELLQWLLTGGSISELAAKTWVPEQTWYARKKVLQEKLKKFFDFS